jgi:hypothetical protein
MSVQVAQKRLRKKSQEPLDGSQGNGKLLTLDGNKPPTREAKNNSEKNHKRGLTTANKTIT